MNHLQAYGSFGRVGSLLAECQSVPGQDTVPPHCLKSSVTEAAQTSGAIPKLVNSWGGLHQQGHLAQNQINADNEQLWLPPLDKPKE